MSDSQNQPDPERGGADDADRDLAEHERPDVGLIADEDLPEDLQPTDDNPLAKNPDAESGEDEREAPGKVEGMPDMGAPGAPA